MNYRIFKFYARKEHTSDTTITVDLNMVDPISSIVIEIGTTNATDGLVAHLMNCITKLEVIDGSDVLYSLDGYEADALDWYNQKGKFRCNDDTLFNGSAQKRYVGINFGRYLWDKEYAFDPKRFTNPQLRLTLDINGGGATPSSLFITMFAAMFDQRLVSPVGLFMSKEIKKWTVGSDTHEYTELPLDYPYRNVYLRVFAEATPPSQCIYTIKLSEDQDKRIPIDLGPVDLLRCVANRYPYVEEDYRYIVKAVQQTLYCAASDWITAYANQWGNAAGGANIALGDYGGGSIKCLSSSGSQTAQIHVRGYVPHCVWEIPCGLQDDPEDFYDVRSLRSLRADIHGVTASTAYLFLQQVRNY